MSATDFAMIRPVAITDARLTSSTVLEPATVTNPDPAAWAAATAYIVGQQASRIALHKIYQRVIAGTTATAPESDTANWIEAGATNRWKMFDGSVESQTTKTDSIVVVLTPGVLADSLVAINVDADSIRVQVAGTTYDQTQQLAYRSVSNWYEYYFEPFVYKVDVVFTGIPLLLSNVITYTLTKTGSTVKCGALVLGLSKAIGGTEYGASVGIIDYSRKSTNAFGNTTVVARAYSKRMNVTLFMDGSKVDDVQRLLAEYRATPVVWIGAGNLYGALIVYGFYKSFDIVIAYPNHSKVNLEIEGIV